MPDNAQLIQAVEVAIRLHEAPFIEMALSDYRKACQRQPDSIYSISKQWLDFYYFSVKEPERYETAIAS